jgi:hypothetical protein
MLGWLNGLPAYLKRILFFNPKEKSMKRNIILTVLFSAMLGGLYAQDSLKKAGPSFLPQKGDFSGAILFGRGNFLNSGLQVSQTPSLTAVAPTPGSPSGLGVTYQYNWYVGGTSPYNNTVQANDNNVTNIIGGELRYFLLDRLALKLSGGAIISNTPARGNVPGFIVTDKDGNVTTTAAAWLPAYNAVVADSRSDININLGVEKHFAPKYSKLSPYAGLTVPFFYGRRSQYDPTINDAKNPSDPLFIVDIGVRHAELVGFGLQSVAGLDYYLMEGFYFGFEMKPISYVYSYTTMRPGPGLPVQKAENHSVSFFAQTFLKIGFKF